MSTLVATAGRRLPRGWLHLWAQVAFWLGFYVVYQVVRGTADRDVARAFTNGEWVIKFERHFGGLGEQSLQRMVDGSSLLIAATSYTYWLSQFVVVGLALIWVYFVEHGAFAKFRNTLIFANLVGLALYVFVPTAPPRMFPAAGFVDTLAEHSSVNHSSSVISALANPYAAMPSLHSMDALIVGVVLACLVRSRAAKVLWLLWAPWVWFSVMSTGNHYWLDIAAGVAIAIAVGAVVYRGRLPRREG